MTTEAAIVFGIAGVAMLLLATERLRYDMVALLVLLSLALSGVLTEREVLAGFGSPVVLIVAGLLVVGEMLTRTGVASAIGAIVAKRAGKSEVRLVILLMLVAGVLGSVMSSTAVVAILIPVVATTAAPLGINVSKLLMPMSYGALISGMLTLIGTPANLVVSRELQEATGAGFGFFTFVPVGVAVLVSAIVYMVFVGRRLLPGEEVPVRTPAAGMRDIAEEYGILGKFHRLRVPVNSPLARRTLREAAMSGRNLRVSVVERQKRVGVSIISEPAADFVVRPGDILVVHGPPEAARELQVELELVRMPITEQHRRLWIRYVGLVTLFVHPQSSLIGQSVVSSRFRERFGFQALALRRKGALIDDFASEELRVGDALLVQGPWRRIPELREYAQDFVLMTIPEEAHRIAPEVDKAPIALTILTAMIVLSVTGVVPVSIAVLAAAGAAVATRCITMTQGYRAIHWEIVLLLAGMIPLADAMEKSGGLTVLVSGLLSVVGDAGPHAMLIALFALTASLSMVMSNTATAVLVAPMAMAASHALGVSPEALMMTVAIASSAAFASPVASPVVTLVTEPGQYRFAHFLKVGLPLLLLTGAVTVLVTPLVFPF